MKNEKDSVPRLVSDTQKLLQDFTEREAGGIHSKAAKLLDVSGTTFSQWLHGTRVPSLSQIAPVYERLGVDLDVLASKSLTEFEAKYASIPQVKATAGAGASLEVDDTVTGYHIFSRAFLQSVGVNPNHAVIFPVAGDSMEPLILNGDFVLVDLATQEPEDGKIFVVAFDDHLMVKRLQKIPDGWNLCSENLRYGQISICGDELSNLKVHGRVKWSSHVF